MEKANDGATVYNQIESAFLEFFDNKGISLQGLDYKQVPNSTYQAAFRYCYRKLYKPTGKMRYNLNTTIDTNNINMVIDILNSYIDICKEYNIIGYIEYFTDLTGISNDTINNWYKGYKSGKDVQENLTDKYIGIAKKIKELPKMQVMNNLADDRIGLQSLANNDAQVGLEYNGKRQLEQEAARQLTTTADLRSLLNCPKD